MEYFLGLEGWVGDPGGGGGWSGWGGGGGGGGGGILLRRFQVDIQYRRAFQNLKFFVEVFHENRRVVK